jgi:MoaA/NifB/PqqE/SkfB family radical SAM enzyme
MPGKYVKWDFTTRCNLRCTHCSVGKRYFSGTVRELTLDEKLAVVDNLASGGVEAISFLGGEPLVDVGDFLAVAARASLRGMKTTLVTNGLLLDDPAAARLLDAGVSQVVVSLEGARAETHEAVRGKGTFERVKRNVAGLAWHRAAHGAKVSLKVNTVLSRENRGEIAGMLELCRSLEVDEWALLSLGGIGYAEDHLDALAASPAQEIEAAKALGEACAAHGPGASPVVSPQFVYPLVADYVEKLHGVAVPRSRSCCNAGISLGYVAPDGTLFPCDRIATEEYRGARIRGAEVRPLDLLQTPFTEAWASDYFTTLFELIFDDATYREYRPCNRCKYLKDRTCTPCPLYSLSSKVAIATCMIAAEGLGDVSGEEEGFFAALSRASRSPAVRHARLEREPTAPRLDEQVPSRERGVRSFTNGDVRLLVNPSTVEYVAVDQVGNAVWELIDGRTPASAIAGSVCALASEIRASFSPGPGTSDLEGSVRRNVYAFLAELESAGLIRMRPPAPGEVAPAARLPLS